MAEPEGWLEIEVVYALPVDQRVYPARVPPGADVRIAIESCGILDEHPQLDVDACAVGIYGERVDLHAAVSAGDRIEIYRPLVADPKESRRRRAAKRARM